MGNHCSKKIGAQECKEQKEDQTKESMAEIKRIQNGKNTAYKNDIDNGSDNAKIHVSIAYYAAVCVCKWIQQNMPSNQVSWRQFKWVIKDGSKYRIAPINWRIFEEIKIANIQNRRNKKDASGD